MKEKQSRNIPPLRIIWNWLQLPVLALLLIASIIWLTVQQEQMTRQLSYQQQTTTLQVAHDQQQETLLMNYINTISDLMVHDQLFTAKPATPVSVIAEAQTQEVLKKLDPDHKATLMSFLYSTKLIGNDYHSISMIDADIHDAHLRAIDLRDTSLVGANF